MTTLELEPANVSSPLSTLTAIRDALGDQLLGAPEPTGSRVICPPSEWTASTDHDWLVLVVSLKTAAKGLVSGGFTFGGSFAHDSDGEPLISSGTKFISMRHGSLNLIVTNDSEFFTRFMLATRTATKLELYDKADRICLFQAVLYGNG